MRKYPIEERIAIRFDKMDHAFLSFIALAIDKLQLKRYKKITVNVMQIAHQ